MIPDCILRASGGGLREFWRTGRKVGCCLGADVKLEVIILCLRLLRLLHR